MSILHKLTHRHQFWKRVDSDYGVLLCGSRFRKSVSKIVVIRENKTAWFVIKPVLEATFEKLDAIFESIHYIDVVSAYRQMCRG